MESPEYEIVNENARIDGASEGSVGQQGKGVNGAMRRMSNLFRNVPLFTPLEVSPF
jgi:hypothetical protein